MKNLRILCLKTILILLISVSTYVIMIESGLSGGLAGAVALGTTVIIVQIVLEEISFYNRFKSDEED